MNPLSVWIWLNPHFFMAHQKLKNSSKSAPGCCTTEFWGEWVQRCCGLYPACTLCRQSFHCSHCVARKEFAAKMPTRWVAGGCSNTPDLENGTALHTIPYFGDNRPQVKKRPKKWVYFIKQKRAKWEPSKNLPICSVHFKPEDFQCLFASLPGQSTPSIPRLNRDDFGVVAFPTIHAAGVVIQPPQPERSKRKVRWFDTLFHYKVFLLP